MLTRVVGQRVLVQGGKWHGAARIERVLPKNIDVRMENGGVKVRVYPGFLSDLAEGTAAPTRAGTRSAAVASLPTQPAGAIVRVTGKTGLWVVIADKYDRINVALLGGDAGRYWREPRMNVHPIGVNELTVLLGSISTAAPKPAKPSTPPPPAFAPGDDVIDAEGYAAIVLRVSGKSLVLDYGAGWPEATVPASTVTPV